MHFEIHRDNQKLMRLTYVTSHAFGLAIVGVRFLFHSTLVKDFKCVVYGGNYSSNRNTRFHYDSRNSVIHSVPSFLRER